MRHVPVQGGQFSKNSFPDIELISVRTENVSISRLCSHFVCFNRQDNKISLFYYGRENLESNNLKSTSVKLLERNWQRSDGTTLDREHLLMALAGLQSILIKATYTTGTKEVAYVYITIAETVIKIMCNSVFYCYDLHRIQSVSLDIADSFNTGQNRAVEVEECSCPVGYKGLSCEDCAVGYVRIDKGLYLGECKPCTCNGNSDHCDPDTGVCVVSDRSRTKWKSIRFF